MNIMLDVDGVYADFVKGFYALARTHDDTVPQYATPHQKDWHIWEGVSKKIQNKCWEQIERSSEFWRLLDPIVDAEDRLATRAFVEKQVVYFVTSRPGKDVKYQTEQWLKSYLSVDLPTVLVAETGKYKADIAKALCIDWSLEDNGPNAVAIGKNISNPRQSYLLDRLYNREYSQAPRVKSVSDFFYAITQAAKK